MWPCHGSLQTDHTNQQLTDICRVVTNGHEKPPRNEGHILFSFVWFCWFSFCLYICIYCLFLLNFRRRQIISFLISPRTRPVVTAIQGLIDAADEQINKREAKATDTTITTDIHQAKTTPTTTTTTTNQATKVSDAEDTVGQRGGIKRVLDYLFWY